MFWLHLRYSRWLFYIILFKAKTEKIGVLVMNFLVGQLLGFTDGAHSMESKIWNLLHLLQTAKFDHLNFETTATCPLCLHEVYFVIPSSTILQLVISVTVNILVGLGKSFKISCDLFEFVRTCLMTVWSILTVLWWWPVFNFLYIWRRIWKS